MNESETRLNHIDPALHDAGWKGMIRTEYPIVPGRIQGHGKKQIPKKADYVLEFKNQKLAVVEAKAYDLPLTEGVAQAKDYAAKISVRFAYSTNGQGFYEIDMISGKETKIDAFPTPEELWARTYGASNVWRERFAEIPFEDKGGTHRSRYYQDIAVDRVLEAIALEKDRVLLTLATGTGKTFISFQIAWKLFHSRWNLSGEPTRRPRILFLADRNILADQAFNAFSAFEETSPGSCIRINPGEIRTTGRPPTNGSVFFTIFQTFMTGPLVDGQPSPYFGDYPPDFFDLIIIDECHRGGANDESNWRAILDHFSPAVQLGLTATPKRRDNIDTYQYFGEPVYIYSLKDGINDGFLTPFRVRRVSSNLDEYEYREEDRVVEGNIERGRVYTPNDFNRTIIIEERERKRVELFMGQINQNQKTLVFCATQEHALLVRDLINQIKRSPDPNYCQRVTANDGALGDQALRDFQDNEKSIPTILTTSQKLSTGVDARNVRNIVLMRPVNSMIEFKQIIGRGTRLFDGKEYFTIFDFDGASRLFADPEWDGEPIEPEKCEDCNQYPCVCLRPICETCGLYPCECPCNECGTRPCTCPCAVCNEYPCNCEPRRRRTKVELADGSEREIEQVTMTSYWHPDGTPISAREFLEMLFGRLPDFFSSEEELRAIWSDPETRTKLLDGLSEHGFGVEQLKEMQTLMDAENSDLFDVLAYVAYALPPLTREQRAAKAKVVVTGRFNNKQQAFIDFVLAHYIATGVETLDRQKLTPLLLLKYHESLPDAIADLGSPESVASLFTGFQKYLYDEKAA